MDELTKKFYNENAKDFEDKTLNVDLSNLYPEFEKHLKKGDKILDLGCGVGRDLRYFKENYKSIGLDGSEELAKIANENTGVKIYNIDYKEMKFKAEFDGVWGLAALVHLKENEIVETLKLVSESLKKGGVFYTSFKEGDFEGYIDGRYFTYMTENKIKKIISEINNFKIESIFYTEDKLKDRNIVWINVIMIKI